MGGQKGIALFYQFLSKKTDVTLISTRNNERPVELNAEFLPILTDSKWRYINPLFFFTILKIFKKRKSTHLLLEHPYLGWLGLLIKSFCNIKLVIHSHNIESLRFKSTGKWWWKLLWHYERFIHRCADINFFITDEDKQYAIEKFNLKDHQCHTITYGFDLSAPPTSDEKIQTKSQLQQQFNFAVDTTIILFNGTLDYKPNHDALDIIINKINPILLQQKQFKYSIIICGKNLPSHYNNLTDIQSKNIIYAGFVEDIGLYFKGSDIFINPVTDGGGIKTKLVEALGYDLFCVSTKNGAIGVPANICNNKLQIIEDNNFEAFANSIITSNPQQFHIKEDFFNHFFWENITDKATEIINN
jgi:glycosyltransferase involved in cell wall biosynthesis